MYDKAIDFISLLFFTDFTLKAKLTKLFVVVLSHSKYASSWALEATQCPAYQCETIFLSTGPFIPVIPATLEASNYQQD